MVEQNGVGADRFRIPSFAVSSRNDNRLIVFGDVANRFFISVFDPAAKKCELCFVTIRPNEAACIDCAERPRAMGMSGPSR